MTLEPLDLPTSTDAWPAWIQDRAEGELARAAALVDGLRTDAPSDPVAVLRQWDADEPGFYDLYSVANNARQAHQARSALDAFGHASLTVRVSDGRVTSPADSFNVTVEGTTVANGVVTGVKTGTATITVSPSAMMTKTAAKSRYNELRQMLEDRRREAERPARAGGPRGIISP